jgi:hypothetical protein
LHESYRPDRRRRKLELLRDIVIDIPREQTRSGIQMPEKPAKP